MQRICTSLAKAGYSVLLIGRKLNTSLPLRPELFQQKRFKLKYNSGMLFYTEYNLKLLYYLLTIHIDVICAIDLDTILPCYFVSVMRRKKRAYDAHELFTEMKEVVTRPAIKRQWLKTERFAVPKFKHGYTVSYSIAEEFKKRYKVDYAVIRNLPYKKLLQINQPSEEIFLYQGAVNEARGLENLVLAMKDVDAMLHIYGDGNIFEKIQQLIKDNELQDKIVLQGKVLPATLDKITGEYYAGINLVEPIGLNQFYSLANKFFDYIQAGIPQLSMSFPEYQKINNKYEVAELIYNVEANNIASALKKLLNDKDFYNNLKDNCIEAREVLVWENEEIKLMEFYKNILAD